MNGPTVPTLAQPPAQPLRRWGPTAVPTVPTFLACVHTTATAFTTTHIRKQVRQVRPVGTDVGGQGIVCPNLSREGLGRLGHRPNLNGIHEELTIRSDSKGSSPTLAHCGFPARDLAPHSLTELWFIATRLSSPGRFSRDGKVLHV